MLYHCNQSFREYEIWFLDDLALFRHRLLMFGKCPNCKKDIALLIEERIEDGRVFQDKYIGYKKIEKLTAKIKHQILYSSNDAKIQKGKPFSWVYGENVEIHNKKGEVVAIKQKACDYFGQKETIKVIDLK